MSIYNEFAHIYDDLMLDFNYEEWADYIEEIYRKYNIEPENILEMACGTGNLTEELVKRGYKITAFDLSEEMLSVAYKKMGRDSRVKLLNLDMTDFKLNDSYDSVVSICDSINYILNDEDLEKTFSNVYNHLNDGGIFVFDVNSYYKLKEIIGNHTFVYEEENIFYTWQNYYDEEENICDFFLTFFIRKEDDEKYFRFDEEHSEKAYRIDEIMHLLEKVGFSKIDYFQGFSFDDVNEQTQRINFVAIK